MVVAATDYGCACGRTESGRVELCVAQSSLCDPIQRRCRDHAAKSATYTIALIVSHDQQNVGRTLWRHYPRWPPRRRFFGRLLNHATERRVGWWKLFAANSGGRVWRARRAGDLLCE